MYLMAKGVLTFFKIRGFGVVKLHLRLCNLLDELS